nr:MAG TPA: hypothetical protein [Caudoviricetes sp.]
MCSLVCSSLFQVRGGGLCSVCNLYCYFRIRFRSYVAFLISAFAYFRLLSLTLYFLGLRGGWH